VTGCRRATHRREPAGAQSEVATGKLAELEPQRVRVAANVEDAQLCASGCPTLPTAGVFDDGLDVYCYCTLPTSSSSTPVGSSLPRSVQAISARSCHSGASPNAPPYCRPLTRRRAALILGPIAASNMMTTAASSARPTSRRTSSNCLGSVIPASCFGASLPSMSESGSIT